MADFDYKKNQDLDLIPKSAGRVYEVILHETYKGIDIHHEPETGFYKSLINEKSYETKNIEFIKNEIDDFANNLPPGTTNNKKNKNTEEDTYSTSRKQNPWTDNRDFIDKTFDFFKELLFKIFIFIQIVSYPMALIKWFIRDFPYFWSGFKELAFALIPIINIIYVIDYWGVPLKILSLPLHLL